MSSETAEEAGSLSDGNAPLIPTDEAEGFPGAGLRGWGHASCTPG